MSRTVTITLSLERAEELSCGMSDLLCWCRGYRAASDGSYAPFGDDETRQMNAILKDAIGAAE